MIDVDIGIVVMCDDIVGDYVVCVFSGVDFVVVKVLGGGVVVY